MTAPQRIKALLRKHELGLTTNQVAEKLELPAKYTHKMLVQLEEKGMVKRSKRKEIRAAVWLSLTAVDLPKPPAARDRAGQAFGKLTRHLGEWLRTLGKA